MPMYTHVLHGRTFVWADKFFMGIQYTPIYAHKKNVYAHKKFTNKQNLVKDMQIPIKNHFFIYEKMHA